MLGPTPRQNSWPHVVWRALVDVQRQIGQTSVPSMKRTSMLSMAHPSSSTLRIVSSSVPGTSDRGTTMQRFSTHMAKALAKGAGWLAWFKKETPRRSAMTLHTFTHDNGIEWRASRVDVKDDGHAPASSSTANSNVEAFPKHIVVLVMLPLDRASMRCTKFTLDAWQWASMTSTVDPDKSVASPIP